MRDNHREQPRHDERRNTPHTRSRGEQTRLEDPVGNDAKEKRSQDAWHRWRPT